MINRQTSWRALTLSVLFAVGAMAGCQGTRQAGGQFGEPVDARAQATDVGEVLANPEPYLGQPVTLRGEVAEVCQKKGCWIKLADAGTSQEPLFVKFTCPINGRLVPTEAAGNQAVVAGTLEKVQISEAAARHYAQDAGASPDEIASIQGPQPILRLKSPGAWIEGVATEGGE